MDTKWAAPSQEYFMKQGGKNRVSMEALILSFRRSFFLTGSVFQGSTKLSPVLHLEHWNFVLLQMFPYRDNYVLPWFLALGLVFVPDWCARNFSTNGSLFVTHRIRRPRSQNLKYNNNAILSRILVRVRLPANYSKKSNNLLWSSLFGTLFKMYKSKYSKKIF